MESLLPTGGFQLPIQRRLSRLYNDTKKSSDFVKEPVQSEEDPEIKALHRKLRIQKDRLVSWGLEWSDPNQSAEIDESLSNAGLSEVVGSIMSTIKDILAEAEPLWLSSKQIVEGGRPSRDRKAPLVRWDKGRFEDLVRDLTSSIDTLYDLSRTRSSGAMTLRSTKSPLKSPQASDDFRPFESSRIHTPQQIDPQTLTHLRPLREPHEASPREVVLMSKTAYSEFTKGTARQPWAPLLLEYATFDSIYSSTGITPPMAQFEKICVGLQQDPQRSPGAWTGLPRLLGYFEEIEKSRLGLVYCFPSSFNAVTSERPNTTPLYNLHSLRELICRPESEPKLEAKFRLAHNLANTVFDMHARGITHGDLVDRNVSFCDAAASDSDAPPQKESDVRRPLLSSFELFPDDASSPASSLSRHPLDPRCTPYSPLSSSIDERILELYSLAMLLLSIGLWTRIEDLIPNTSLTSVPETMLEKLSVRCGTLYMKAVSACWSAVDEELKGSLTGEDLISAVQVRASRFLEACCILDGVSGLEERLSHEIKNASSTATATPIELTKDSKGQKTSPAMPSVNISQEGLLDRQPSKQMDVTSASEIPQEKPTSKSETKMRLYPHVPLAPEVVERWNTSLMPQINGALKSFYRKHPESVEISLESVGPSAHATQPTILVVCTSVGKVRAILRKRLGELFDGSSGFALKVCRGHVLRSRRSASSIMRSMARQNQGGHDDDGGTDDEGDVEAVNPDYQERPGSGASIGAWIGDRHLPPVSFGGLVMVDNKPYGMTVHHMLDDPDADHGFGDNVRSMALTERDWYLESATGSSVEDDFAYDLSDSESEPYSETDITSEYDDEEEDDEDEEYTEPGDIPGIEPGCGDGYVVTQPALDDVEEGFFPSAETEDEDHLDTFSLGEVYASSGIRRKRANGLVHEVDWALFEFDESRLPEDNHIPRAQGATSPRRSRSPHTKSIARLRPTTVAPSTSLPGMEVQCFARTSGLQTGQILPALTSVKIYGRTSPSHTYQIASAPSARKASGKKPPSLMGIPGDSGAWILDRRHGQLCGHVLAWSQRKHVAYICPMDVLLLDIAQTLEANEVRLPGGEAVVTLGDPDECQPAEEEGEEDSDDDSWFNDSDGDDETCPPRVGASGHQSEGDLTNRQSSLPDRTLGSQSAPVTTKFPPSKDAPIVGSGLGNIGGSMGQGIDVGG